MPASAQRARPVWLLTAMGIVMLVIGVSNLATFSGGGHLSKWIQLGVGILSLVLAVAWLTWTVRAARARNNVRVSDRL